MPPYLFPASTGFNPRSPGGERLAFLQTLGFHCKFQSTLPGRGATPVGLSIIFLLLSFNPRSPGGERLPVAYAYSRDLTEFQSTLPGRGATIELKLSRRPSLVSIHAPRAGSDCYI